jgi:hydrogenase-4 component F
MERLPWSGWLFLAALFAITGSPPFSSFVSEFMVISSIFDSNRVFAGVAIAVLFGIIFIGMATTILPILTGRGDSKDLDDSGYCDRLLTIAPPLLLMVITLILGIWIPAPLQSILAEASAMLGGKP